MKVIVKLKLLTHVFNTNITGRNFLKDGLGIKMGTESTFKPIFFSFSE